MGNSQVPAGLPITMYTTAWCPDCWRAKRFLKGNNIGFEEINIDRDNQAAQLVMEVNGGRRSVPTFAIAGSYHGNPPLSELAKLVGTA